ncbi:MAG: hypothetical protein NC238_09990 [Dehalobacter sp.]|nr:hypothetical protein [Dehalobacter sp.]
MKKRLLSILLIMVMSLSIGGGSLQAWIGVQASPQLKSYRISLNADGNNKMTVSFSISGTGLMTKIGAQKILIEKQSGSSWVAVTTYHGSTNPAFYRSNAYSHAYEFSFTGSPGTTYRATLTAYAENSSGSDTQTGVSNTSQCY